MPLETTYASGSSRGFGKKSGGGSLAFARLFINVADNSFVVPSTGLVRVWIGGAGGAGASGTGGNGGIFYFDTTLTAGETVIAGVGQGGQRYAGGSGTLAGGAGGSANTGGGGGAGCFLKYNSAAGRPNWNGYAGIAGGGGGSANHGFTANYGAHGYGVGGTAYNTSWTGSTYGGKSGFDGSGGAGGDAQSGGQNGGYANISGQLTGGQAGYGDQSGGGGGGGAGGGGGGAGGNQSGSSGGYISTTTSAGGYSTVAIPMGGGGGGSHGNNCGGTGGGGGVLLFTDYNNSFNSGRPSFNGTMDMNRGSYAAWNQLAGYSSTYFGGDLTSTTLSSRCLGGSANTVGNPGFVLIASLNKTPAAGLITV